MPRHEHGDITEHLAEVYDASVSAATVSRVIEVVADEIAAWQSRPVDGRSGVSDPLHRGVRIKIRDGGVVANKAAHVVIGVDIDGIKQDLGVWIQQTEGAKFRYALLTELRNRGCRDALFVCCDGLTGLPESIAAVWPKATVQTCVVHLLRASMRYASYSDRKKMATALRPIYTGHRGCRQTHPRGVPRRVEDQITRRGSGLRSGLRRVHAVSGVPGRDPQDHLHHG